MAALPEDWATTLPASVLPLLFKTLVFASTKHANQRRKDPQGTPYINHPIGVAAYLVEAGVTNVSVLQAALLHDTIEDTATTAEELRSEFGDQVTAIVLECSDDTALPSAQRKLIQVEKAAQASTEAKLVKMADKLYNLRDLCRALP
ncbi:Guanosine-3',5'-bis(diphosphate) 3'-pyrophosphohydrolase MESH1, partial [Dimargaris verticillata]